MGTECVGKNAGRGGCLAVLELSGPHGSLDQAESEHHCARNRYRAQVFGQQVRLLLARKGNFRGINEFKRLVLGEEGSQPNPFYVEIGGTAHYLVSIPLYSWNPKQKSLWGNGFACTAIRDHRVFWPSVWELTGTAPGFRKMMSWLFLRKRLRGAAVDAFPDRAGFCSAD